MNDNIIVQTLWISNELGEHQKFCLQSFLDNGHDVHLYSYGEVTNLPIGVKLMDADVILAEDLVFKDLFNSYATFSDWFRIKLLYEVGGWWVDSDMLCIKHFHVDWPYVFATEIEKNGNDEITHICNCVIKMPKGNDMAKSILSRIDDCLRSKNPVDIKWTEIGAKYMQNEIIDRDLVTYIVSPEVFCPFDYSSFESIFTEEKISLDKETFGIHLWNKMWEWSKREPMDVMTGNSIFSRFVEK
ncbi:hypothetical protein M8998_01500 [Sphingobacterium sp. lm-10]|uniref:capsular polysaccharide synthesis protein n=1 Tax=Sphingobacterium sp. lm-10 TaxID=2944904 RepID=UPI0020209AC4|nr:capsular polysaccharide synthesis protein [Sphingobacterium sp. lm-10]MCL7986605.1 hypothetical protein [Sphingobacterium sp. lm-10]